MLVRLRLIALAFVLTLDISAASFGTNASTRVTSIIPFASTVAAANSNGVPILKMESLLETDAVRAGDSVTALVTLVEKGQRRQWLLYTRILSPPTKTNKSLTIYNSFGNMFEFPSIPTSVSLRTLGPFIDANAKMRPPKMLDDSTTLDLDKGFLSLGLEQAAAAIYRLEPKKKTGGRFASGTHKFSDDEIKLAKQLAADWKPTLTEERAFGGSYPALLSYFSVVQHTESLSDILAEVVDRPSLFSLAANLGIREVAFDWKGAHPSKLPAAAWGLGEEIPIYEIPMILHLNQHPALNITLIVTAPKPPLLTSAGIIGVLGEKPGKKEPYMVIRIIDARLGAAAAAAK